MKFFIWVISFVNVYLGMRSLLNVIGILQTSKYSRTATAVFAILFLGMGIIGIYFFLEKHNARLALWIGIGPWALALLFLLFNMLTGDYK